MRPEKPSALVPGKQRAADADAESNIQVRRLGCSSSCEKLTLFVFLWLSGIARCSGAAASQVDDGLVLLVLTVLLTL